MEAADGSIMPLCGCAKAPADIADDIADDIAEDIAEVMAEVMAACLRRSSVGKTAPPLLEGLSLSESLSSTSPSTQIESSLSSPDVEALLTSASSAILDKGPQSPARRSAASCSRFCFRHLALLFLNQT